MPAKKPAALNVRHDTQAEREARAAREDALTPQRSLPAAPPARLDGHDVARATWRRLLREYGELQAAIVTRLDLDMLTDYCLLTEQAAELDRMRQVAYQLWLEQSGKHDELAKAGEHDAAVEMAMRVVGAFDAIVKLDGRVDRKRALLHQWRQSLYLTPRTRAGVAPAPKPAPEPEDEMERMLRGVDLGSDTAPAAGGSLA